MARFYPTGGGGGADVSVVTATADDVVNGAVFVDSDGNPVTGTMTDKSGTTQSATASLDATNGRVQMIIPTVGKYNLTSKLYAAYSTIRNLIGLTAAKLANGVSILGLTGTYTGLGTATADKVLTGSTFSSALLSNASGAMPNNGAVSKTLNCGESYTIPAGYHNGSGTVVAKENMWTGWKQICKYENIATSMDSTPVDGDEYALGTDFSAYNTFIFRVVYTTGTSSGSVGTYTYQDTFVCTRKADDSSSHSITPNKTKNAYDESVYRNLEYSVGVSSDAVVDVYIIYEGDSETEIMYGNFEVVLIAAMTL